MLQSNLPSFPVTLSRSGPAPHPRRRAVPAGSRFGTMLAIVRSFWSDTLAMPDQR